MLNLDKNKKYLLACSFGPDSMALFHMLKTEGYNFAVAHVNYHFREESDLEEEGLREYCAENNVELFVYSNEIKVFSNLEAKARDIRYQFFASVYRKHNFDYLLVAHHQNDLIETYLLQKKRDICTFYYGINEISNIYDMQVIRPLLSCSKEELLRYNNKNHVPYMIDRSNESDVYLRNRIRHQIVNRLSNEEKKNCLNIIKEDNDKINAIISRIDQDKINDVSYLLSLDQIHFKYAIFMLANKAQIFKISEAILREIKKVLHSPRPNVKFMFKGYYFVKEYDAVYFDDGQKQEYYSYTLEEPDFLDTPYFFLDFKIDSTNRNVKPDDYPITIRNALKGDRVKIKNYYKDVRRLFIDWKMPLSLRKRWPLITNKNGVVIYIPRYKKDFVLLDDMNFYVK